MYLNYATIKCDTINTNIVKVGNCVDIWDVVLLVGNFIISFVVFIVSFYIYSSYIGKKYKKSNNIEEKLDRIIDLLEKDKKA
ncbi:DUF4083 family protein [Metabacillus schmidteae]|uniref:DUF4083 family protein n=1 Tax=Metabacillus schmidteae TaxID=2730405 RepID=UPI0038B2B600